MSAIENGYYSHESHGEYDLISIGRLDLEEGGSIPDCQLAVATFGTLSAAKDNAIGGYHLVLEHSPDLA